MKISLAWKPMINTPDMKILVFVFDFVESSKGYRPCGPKYKYCIF